MPKLGMEPVRRAALIDATIQEIGETGSLDVTMSRIAVRAGVSAGLAHHYFGGKEQLLISAMRHLLRTYRRDALVQLGLVEGHRDRLRAIVLACFGAPNFRSDVIAAWLNFYVLAQTSAEARRLLAVYHRRLHSNLVHDLAPLVGPDRAPAAALRIAGLIDGLYLRSALTRDGVSAETVAGHVLDALTIEIGEPR